MKVTLADLRGTRGGDGELTGGTKGGAVLRRGGEERERAEEGTCCSRNHAGPLLWSYLPPVFSFLLLYVVMSRGRGVSRCEKSVRRVSRL